MMLDKGEVALGLGNLLAADLQIDILESWKSYIEWRKNALAGCRMGMVVVAALEFSFKSKQANK